MPSKESVAVEGLESMDHAGYSQVVRFGDQIYVAGMCGLDTNHEIVSTEFEPQVHAMFDRLKLALEAVDCKLDDVMSMMVFVTDIRYGKRFGAIRRQYFSQPYPTSAVIGVDSLMPEGALVEVQVTAIAKGTSE